MDKLILSAVLLGFLASCGGGQESGGVSVEPPNPILVQVVPDPMLPVSGNNPPIYELAAGATIQFHAVTAQGNRVDSEVVWDAINRALPAQPAGSITVHGLYTAPAVATTVEIDALVKQGIPQPYTGYAKVNVTSATPAPSVQ